MCPFEWTLIYMWSLLSHINTSSVFYYYKNMKILKILFLNETVPVTCEPAAIPNNPVV